MEWRIMGDRMSRQSFVLQPWYQIHLYQSLVCFFAHYHTPQPRQQSQTRASVYLVQLPIQFHLLKHLVIVLWFIHLHPLPRGRHKGTKRGADEDKKTDMKGEFEVAIREHTTIAYTLALKNVKTKPVFLSSDLNASKIRDVGCPAISAINPDTCSSTTRPKANRERMVGMRTVFMFVTSFWYSARSSCSRGVNCGGGEGLWDVESDIAAAIASESVGDACLLVVEIGVRVCF